MRTTQWATAALLVAMCSSCAQPLAIVGDSTQEPSGAANDGSSVSWRNAIAAIATSERYGGITLREHEGLLPIGVDPESKLWEFVHIASGTPGKAIPARDPATGHLVADGDMGIVLVLLPGGMFWMGAQRYEENEPNYDPQAFGNEGPVHSVTLSPFFIGKYEVTQGQWLRWTGSNPSASRNFDDWTLPVTNVSWNDVDAATRNAGLLLPTEAQWEYACRAGTSTPWWTGADDADLAKGAVFGDASLASVGSKAANGLGLCDTAGNVFEWCRDAYAEYSSSPVVDPCVSGGPSRVYRGGCWFLNAGGCRSAAREIGEPGDADDLLGFRVVMDAGVVR